MTTDAAPDAPLPKRTARSLDEAPPEPEAPFVLGSELDELPVEDEPDAPAAEIAAVPAADGARPPPWAKIPKRGLDGGPFRFARGVKALFALIPAEWTRTPQKGDRQVILWELSDGDETLAMERALGDPHRARYELIKATIRAVDGHVATFDDGASPGYVPGFWTEIGAKGRHVLTIVFNQTHNLTPAEVADFFVNRLAGRAAG